MLRSKNVDKRYICIDTFGGFIKSQFDEDVELGNQESNRHVFDANSMGLARWVLDNHSASHVELIQADVAAMDESLLPNKVSACLIDVDLANPVNRALEIVYPRLSPGGIVIVDDCPENYDWQARKGYEAFMQNIGLPPRYKAGMGVLAKESTLEKRVVSKHTYEIGDHDQT